MIRVLLVDDEAPARELLLHYLSFYPQVEVVGVCGDGFCGIKMIQEHKPDVVFLDIQMPKLTGFELLELIEELPLIVFSTAYDQYAIKAFEINAIDYLLKPYDKDRFDKAMSKVLEKWSTHQSVSPAIKQMSEALAEGPSSLARIAVKQGAKILVIPTSAIAYISAVSDYVLIHTADGDFLKEKTMKYYENQLDKSQFVRIHRSYLVNINEIQRIDMYDKESYRVTLKNKQELKASISGYKQLKALINL